MDIIYCCDDMRRLAENNELSFDLAVPQINYYGIELRYCPFCGSINLICQKPKKGKE